jgi:putative endonuclease
MKKSGGSLGKAAEERARKFLADKGYAIITCNWKFNRYEIDIIAEKDDVIVFFEVKARSTDVFGDPEMAVNRRKQSRIILAAGHYLKENAIEKEARFDIISILSSGVDYSIKHLERAFYPLAR